MPTVWLEVACIALLVAVLLKLGHLQARAGGLSRVEAKVDRAVMFDVTLSRQTADGSWTVGYIGPVFATVSNLTILQLDNAAVPIYQR